MDRITNELGCFREIIVAYCGCDELASFLGLKKIVREKKMFVWWLHTIGAGGSTVGRTLAMRFTDKKSRLAIFENCLVVLFFDLVRGHEVE